MLYLDGFVGFIMLALWIFCVVDVITTSEGACRNLPKIGWLLIVLLIPTIGAIFWLVAGRPWAGVGGQNRLIPPARGYPEYERLGRSTATNPDDDEEFLKQCRARAEEQRRKYEQRNGEPKGEG